MPKKKLTAKLREKIRADYRTLHKADFDGDALAYLNRVRGAAKARKIKADTTIIVNGFKVPRNSFTYDVLTNLAKDAGTTPAKLIKKNPQAFDKYVTSGGRFDFNREADYLKTDILKMKGDVYLNGRIVDKSRARYVITRLKNKVVANGKKTHILNIEHYYDGKGNLHLELPEPKDYKGMTDEEIFDMIESDYPDIAFYIS